MTVAPSGDLDEAVQRPEVADDPVHIEVDPSLDALGRDHNAGVGIVNLMDPFQPIAGNDAAGQEEDLVARGGIPKVLIDVESGLSGIEDDQPLPDRCVLRPLDFLG